MLAVLVPYNPLLVTFIKQPGYDKRRCKESYHYPSFQSVQGRVQSLESHLWLQVIQDELHSMDSQNGWTVVHRPKQHTLQMDIRQETE